MSRIVTIVGSTSEISRTRRLAIDIQRQIAARAGADASLIDIATLLPELAVRSATEAGPLLQAALHAIETADLLVAASPVYKGSYTGLFKHLIDLVDYRALEKVPVALVAVGGSDRHALMVEHQMRPLFASLGAHTLPTGVFVVDASISTEGVSDPKTGERLDRMIEEAVLAIADHRQWRDRPSSAVRPTARQIQTG